MKKIIAAIAIATAVIATPAMANPFSGPRAEARAGFDNLTVTTPKVRVKADGLTYGVGLGYDLPLSKHIVVGADVALDSSTGDATVKSALAVNAKRKLEVSGRLGYAFDTLLLYGRLGYVNQIVGLNFKNVTKEGLLYGAGAELALGHNLFVNAEYRQTRFDANAHSHQGLVGLGLRF